MTTPTPTSESRGVCPVCNGTKRIPATGRYEAGSATYDDRTNTIACKNCGGQYMSMMPRGHVALRPDGTPCEHQYSAVPSRSRNSYTVYLCDLCGDSYDWDSGD